MATLTEYFERVPANACWRETSFQVIGPAGPLPIRVRQHYHVDARAQTLSFLFTPPTPADGEALVGMLLKKPPVAGRTFHGLGFPPIPDIQIGVGVDGSGALDVASVQLPDGRRTTRADYRFTELVLVHVATALDQAAHVRLHAIAAARGLTLGLRDAGYVQRMNRIEVPDAYLIHDARDKDAIARPLALALQEQGYLVWYDELSLTVGDSLLGAIEAGLRACRTCVLVVTPRFFESSRWKRKELEMAFTRELETGKRLLLPVWSEVTSADVFAYSVPLADRVAIDWSRGLPDVVAALRKAIARAAAE